MRSAEAEERVSLLDWQVARSGFWPTLNVDAGYGYTRSNQEASFILINESLGFTGTEILQLRVGEGCSWLGRPLGELDFPRDAVVGAVLKRGSVVTPRGDTVLAAGNEVVVFSLPGSRDEIEEFFLGGES